MKGIDKNWGGSSFELKKQDPFSSGSSLEIDLRSELKKILYGDGVMSGKGFQVILRQTIKGVRGRAWNRGSGVFDEADASNKNISRYAWPKRDVLITLTRQKFVGLEFMTPVGEMDYSSAMFFMEHNVVIGRDDEIIEVATDDNGKATTPVKYIKRYSIKDVELYHGNNGRVEFIRAIAAKSE